MKSRTIITIGIIITVAISIILISLEYNQETKSVMEIITNDKKPEPVHIPDPICFVVDRSTSGETGSAVTMDACFSLNQFEEMGCTKPMLEHILEFSNLLDYEVDGLVYLEWAGLPNGVYQEKFDECFDAISEKRPILNSKHPTTLELEPEPIPEPDLVFSPKPSKGTITHEKIFTEDGPLQVCKIQEDGDKNCGSPVLNEENCVRYTVWLNEFQKEKISRTEDFPRYPPWGNQIFPLVNYCESVGEFYHTLIEDSTTEIVWSFVPDEQNKDKVIAGFEYFSGTKLTIQEQESYCEERNAFRTGTNACQYHINPNDCSDNGFDYKRGNCNPDYG